MPGWSPHPHGGWASVLPLDHSLTQETVFFFTKNPLLREAPGLKYCGKTNDDFSESLFAFIIFALSNCSEVNYTLYQTKKELANRGDSAAHGSICLFLLGAAPSITTSHPRTGRWKAQLLSGSAPSIFASCQRRLSRLTEWSLEPEERGEIIYSALTGPTWVEHSCQAMEVLHGRR